MLDGMRLHQLVGELSLSAQVVACKQDDNDDERVCPHSNTRARLGTELHSRKKELAFDKPPQFVMIQLDGPTNQRFDSPVVELSKFGSQPTTDPTSQRARRTAIDELCQVGWTRSRLVGLE